MLLTRQKRAMLCAVDASSKSQAPDTARYLATALSAAIFCAQAEERERRLKLSGEEAFAARARLSRSAGAHGVHDLQRGCLPWPC